MSDKNSTRMWSRVDKLPPLELNHIKIIETKAGRKIALLALVFPKIGEIIDFEIEILDVEENEFQIIRNQIHNDYNNYQKIIKKSKNDDVIDNARQYSRLLNECHDLWRIINDNDINRETNKELWEILFSNTDSNKSIHFLSKKFIVPIDYIADANYNEHSIESLLVSKFRIRKVFRGQGRVHSFALPYKPAILFFYLERLSGAVKELKFLEELKEEGLIYLKSFGSKDVLSEKDLISKIQTEDFDILHLSSHVHHPDGLKSFMDFGVDSFRETDIVDIKEKLEGKLVFFNGCKTDFFDVQRTFGFTRNFMANNTSALICVDVEVSDNLAWEFSKKVYQKLIRKECYLIQDDKEKHCYSGSRICNHSIEKILQCTSKEILKDMDDIGGYFYSIYGKAKLN